MYGNNVFILVKTGKNLKADMNAKSFSNCTYSSYDYGIFFPYRAADHKDGEHDFHTKCIGVMFQDSLCSNLY